MKTSSSLVSVRKFVVEATTKGQKGITRAAKEAVWKTCDQGQLALAATLVGLSLAVEWLVGESGDLLGVNGLGQIETFLSANAGINVEDLQAKFSAVQVLNGEYKVEVKPEEAPKATASELQKKFAASKDAIAAVERRKAREQAEADARAERIRNLHEFWMGVMVGLPKTGPDGKTYLRCAQGRECKYGYRRVAEGKRGFTFVGKWDEQMFVPSLDEMKSLHGGHVTVADVQGTYAVCPDCASVLIADQEHKLSVADAVLVVEDDWTVNGETYLAEAEKRKAEVLNETFYSRSPEARQGKNGKRGNGHRSNSDRRHDRDDDAGRALLKDGSYEC